MNDYNGPLPKVPTGHKNWREVYARSLAGLAEHNPAPHHSATVIIELNGKERERLSYATLAHYAAREWAAVEQDNPPLTVGQLSKFLGAIRPEFTAGYDDLKGWAQRQLAIILHNKPNP